MVILWRKYVSRTESHNDWNVSSAVGFRTKNDGRNIHNKRIHAATYQVLTQRSKCLSTWIHWWFVNVETSQVSSYEWVVCLTSDIRTVVFYSDRESLCKSPKCAILFLGVKVGIKWSCLWWCTWGYIRLIVPSPSVVWSYQNSYAK